MAQSINLGATPIPSGTQSFTIDTLPNNTSGFSLVIDRNASWDSGAGTLFDLLLEFSANGAVFREWFRSVVARGPAKNKDGSTATQFRLSGTWPGEADGNGNRIPLRAASLRVTLTVPTAFSIAGLSLSVA